ncbi:MAG: asparagine synthase (glutamine-hydrolyzing) [Gemmatimonadetes bacterium]|nr:asparagine synthase (glutamine-hydrolyzing) [Gemmatimonadota bacterium]
MCGIYGMVSVSGRPIAHPEHADAMRRSLAHRGPDGHGCMSRPYAIVGVNRLRIMDRRPEADQPLADTGGRVWVAVNGEIYNAPDIRRRFPDYPYRTRGDTEAVLPLYLARGPEALSELEGMFAVAIWDDRTRTLTLARDRAGEKPLFIRELNGETWFASEIQALLNGSRPSLDRAVLADIVRLGYPLEPRTMWEGITRVESGTIVTIGPEGSRAIRYWDPLTEDRARHTAHGARDSATELGALLHRSVRKQLVADVPVGVFTSGGLDSSLIVAMAAKEMDPGQLHTFAVRFPEASYDEGPFARDVATRFGTRHVEAEASPAALCQALDRIRSSVAEPISDPAVLPTLILATAAKSHVCVVLSGEGADELFGGYPTYLGHKLAPWFNRLPAPVRRLVAGAINRLPSSYGKVTPEFLLKRFVASAELPWQERHVEWFGTGLGTEMVAPALADSPGFPPGLVVPDPGRQPGVQASDAMHWDYSSYLRDLMLAKNDRATSLVALEARAPFLDTAVTQFAFGLPDDFKVRGLTTKWLLRRAARAWLPASIVNRRKRGLSVPVAALLNGALSSAVDRVLAPDRLKRQGLLNPGPVSQLVAEHRRGRLTLTRGLWTLFVLGLWMEHWMPEGTG